MSVYGVQGITYTPPKSVGSTTTTPTDPEAQKMDFIQLLIAEITNQTPDSPMEPTAMITQYAQMESSIGLMKLNAASTVYQNSAIAAGLMNQQVTVKVGTGKDTGTFSGQVTAVDFSGDSPMVKVGELYYPLSSVIHVGA
ncbi:hypothetical protein J7643_15445 [bacterium]|nr:hypothetical protein [bacterium]